MPSNRDPSLPLSKASEPLGHGDHWTAIFADWSTRLAGFASWLYAQSEFRATFAPLEPNTGFEKVLRLGFDLPAAELAVLLGKRNDNRCNFLSAYPILRVSRAWTVRVEKTSTDYGPFEGIVDLELRNGARLRCFDPRFGENVDRWICERDASVSLTGLALRLERFDAAPLRVTEGPLLELERDSLRQEGKTAEAASLSHVDVQTDGMRTLYCVETDHANLVGRVERVREIPAHAPLPAGCVIEIEALPDDGQPAAERVLPVLAFAPTLVDYRPQPGDLVQGVVWLQASPTTG